jgi:hypothetical protein
MVALISIMRHRKLYLAGALACWQEAQALVLVPAIEPDGGTALGLAHVSA